VLHISFSVAFYFLLSLSPNYIIKPHTSIVSLAKCVKIHFNWWCHHSVSILEIEAKGKVLLFTTHSFEKFFLASAEKNRNRKFNFVSVICFFFFFRKHQKCLKYVNFPLLKGESWTITKMWCLIWLLTLLLYLHSLCESDRKKEHLRVGQVVVWNFFNLNS
jgi:hypothetical protein